MSRSVFSSQVCLQSDFSSLRNIFHKMDLILVPFSSVQFSSVAQLCPTLWDPIDYSPLGSSVHRIFQARIRKWIAICLLQGTLPTDGTHVSCIAGIGIHQFFATVSRGKPCTKCHCSALNFNDYKQSSLITTKNGAFVCFFRMELLNSI